MNQNQSDLGILNRFNLNSPRSRDKNGTLILIGTIPVPISKDKCPPVARREKRRLVRQGATIFKKELVR